MSGTVLMSLPNTAEVRVNWVPVSCMPSPESPAKRIVTRSRSIISWLGVSFVRVVKLASLRFRHKLMRPGRQVQDLLRESFGQKVDDIESPDHADGFARFINYRDIVDFPFLHQTDRRGDRITLCERPGNFGHEFEDARFVFDLTRD